MSRHRFRTLDQADRDFDNAIDYYLIQATEPVAERFVDAVLAAYEIIKDNPEIGSSRIGESIGLPSLRTWAMRGFPYVICYQIDSDGISVWRLLRAQSDIPAQLGQTEA